MDKTKGTVRIESPAKVNLYLEITGKRADGYHELKMINVAVDLFDTLTISPREDGRIVIRCDHPVVPRGADNLCHRAARSFSEAYPGSARGFDIDIKKRIPVAGGLAGGSSNAAAVLLALSKMRPDGIARRELSMLGAEISADVPFFLHHSPAWVFGKGEKVEKAPPLPDWGLLLICFDFGISASDAYREWDLTFSGKKVSLDSVEKGKPLSVKGPWRNDLEEVVKRLHPGICRAEDDLIRVGAQAAMMTGSGPTVFGVFADDKGAGSALRVLDREEGYRVIQARILRGPVLNMSGISSEG